jgi:hypothetical protein
MVHDRGSILSGNIFHAFPSHGPDFGFMWTREPKLSPHFVFISTARKIFFFEYIVKRLRDEE